ncbi:YciI family protein [Algicella marina]|uniref:YCII-related domain-containing protein n=1 Tax=Algicella marina TaxID=2683284 RepID=A0A6P1SXB8_9RHOB|nr:YciI family protein [Algicella marina]QHQ33983.1 hypothetical protein GO499_01685 [Algicella marina]
MFVVLLRFAANRAAAPEHMQAHNEWIAQGFEAGVFQLVGSLAPAGGGGVLAHGESRAEIEARVAEDPFVVHGVVTPEIIEINAKRTAPALAFAAA